MSRGRKQLIVRVSDEQLAKIEELIKSRNLYTREAEWTISDWVRTAIDDKIKHTERSRSKQKGPTTDESET